MRGKQAPKRQILPDPKFHNVQIAKLVNYLMRDGKRSTAQAIVYRAFDSIAEKSQLDPVEVFDVAIKNITPLLEVKSRRVGGGNYQVPTPVRGDRRFVLAYRWLITAVRAKKGRPTEEKLADELLAAYKNEGDAIKKKLDVQRMAEANRAYAHFAR